MIERLLFVILIFVFLLSGCGSENIKTRTLSENSEGKPKSSPVVEDSISISLRDRLNQIQIFYNEALKCIHKEDSIGAEIYFTNALEIVSLFSEEDRDEIQDNPLYATILKSLDSDYKATFGHEEDDPDTDMVMEEIGEAEDQIAMLPDSLSARTEKDLEISSSYPLVINPRVSAAMTYFQTRGRKIFTRWLERSGRYKELYTGILKDEGVPEELFYLAMLESGFINYAYSYARAAGPWQFMAATGAATGAAYGLRNSWWFDERRDPLKATDAAAKHLKYLYDFFGEDWVLAIAGYNVSPGKVKRRMRIQNTRDFWQLKKLPRQTLNYVPTFMAAAIMALEPEKYGFYPDYQAAFVVDTVIVQEAIDLSLIAQWTDTTYIAIKELNPAVIRWCTPPGVSNFSVNIPTGKRESFYAGLNSIPEKEKVSYVRYRIREGDALGLIAQKYGVSIAVIKKQNRIRGTQIYAGKYLIIPVPKNKQAYYASRRKSTYSSRKKYQVPKSIPGREKVIYVVKSGDTVGQIAEDYHIRASEIRRWNGISSRSVIYLGQKLTIFTPTLDKGNPPIIGEEADYDLSLKPGEIYYIIKSGDTLWEIAQRNNTTVERIKLRNKVSTKIIPGEKLIISR